MRDRRRSIFVSLLGNAATDHRGILRLTNDYLGVRHLLSQNARDTFQSSTGAIPGDPVVELQVLEVFDDFTGCCARMHLGISLILELPCEEPAMRGGEFVRLIHHPHPTLGGWCQHDLGTEEAHEFAALNAEGLGHGADEWIALRSTDHGKTDASVTTGSFDHRLAGV